MKSKKFKSLTSLRLITLLLVVCLMAEILGGNVVYASELFTGDNTYKQSNESYENETISKKEVVSSENDSNYIEVSNFSNNEDIISNVKQNNEEEITNLVSKENEDVINSEENIVQDKEVIKEESINDNFENEKLENFNDFDVAIAGLLDNGSNDISYESILNVKNRIPEGKGIWIVPENREFVLNIINGTSLKQYYIDQNGFLKQSENINEAGSKENDEIIDKFISSEKVLIIGRSNGWNEYDTNEGKVVHKTFTKENSCTIIGDEFTNKIVILSDTEDESKLKLVLVDKLDAILRSEELNIDTDMIEENDSSNSDKENNSEVISDGSNNSEVEESIVISGNFTTRSSVGTIKLQDPTSSVNVRSGPSTSYSIVGSFKHGTGITILGSDNGWYKIGSNGIVGYVRSDFVVFGGISSTDKNVATIKLQDPSSTVNFRSGPSTSYSIVGSIPHGVCVSVLDQSGDWYKISFLGTIGYVRGDFLSFASGSLSVASGTVKLQDTTSSVNIRSGSSTSYSIVGSLKHGAVVKILGSESGWYKINYNGITGYVRADYITPGLSSGSSSTGTGTIKLSDTSSSVNVRSGSSTNYSIVGSLRHGAAVTILGSENGWYKISSGSITGYVRADFISLSGATSTNGSTGTVKLTDTSSSVNVRSGSGTNYSVVGSLNYGAVVQILGSENGWYKINSNGLIGYIRADFISTGGSLSTGSGSGTVKLSDPSSCLNVRSGASTTSSVIGTIYHGTVVQILGSESGWYKINAGGITGYVRGDFIVLDGTNASGGMGTIKLQDTSSTVNIRSGSSTSYSIVGSLYHGNVVQILGSENGWYKISCNGITGFVRADFIVIGDSSSYTGVGTIKLQDPSSTVNLRKGSSTSTSIITSLYHGTVVQILGSENGWYKVSYNGLTGYIRADFISLGGNSFIGSDSPCYSATLKENYIRYFSQDDPGYGLIMYSNHGDITQTISSSGCGPTAYSIVVSTLNRIDVPPTEMCRYALAKGFRTYNNGTNSNMFTTAASDFYNPRYNLNYSYVRGVSEAKNLLSDGRHLVIASMSSGHVTRQGHYIVLAGTTVINGKVYFKVYDPHRWNEYYIYDNELIDTVKEDGFILLSETAVKNEANGFWGFSNKNNSVIDTNINASNGNSGGSVIKPTTETSIVPKSDVSYITLDFNKYSKDVQEKINVCLKGIESNKDDEFWFDYYMSELERIIEYADKNGKTNISITDRLVGIAKGTLQAIGGFTEASAGAALFAGTSWTGFGIPIGIGGAYMFVDGTSNFSEGVTQIYDSLFGTNIHDTANFMKNGYKFLSPKYGETIYNLTQLGIGIYSVGKGLVDISKKAVRIYPVHDNIALAESKNLITKTVVTELGQDVIVTTKSESGMILQRTIIDKTKIECEGFLYIGVDTYLAGQAEGSLKDK